MLVLAKRSLMYLPDLDYFSVLSKPLFGREEFGEKLGEEER